MFQALRRWLTGTLPPEPAQAEEVDARPHSGSVFSTEIGLDGGKRAAPQTAIPLPKLRIVGTTTGQDSRTTTTVATMDSSNFADGLKAAYMMGQVGVPELQALWYGTQSFIGYQMCAIMAQHWLVKKACLVPARDAVRKGYRFATTDGTPLTPEMTGKIEKANKRYRLNRNLVEFIDQGRTFGIRVAMFVIESDDPDYYVKPFNPDGIKPGSYRGISQIDPYWMVPELTSVASMDPAAIDFYEPAFWVVGSRRIHKSHLVIMRGPSVPDVLKPSYMFGGVSTPQAIFERVYAAERTANEAPQLALSKRTTVFYTDGAAALANQAAFEEKLTVWARFRDNFGVKVADKEADKVEQFDTSLSELDAVIMTQYQLVASACNVPVTKLLGTTPKGFNSTGDYETDSYHEELEAIQTNDLEPLIDRHMVCVIRSDIAPALGVTPFTVECVFNPLTTLSTIEQATVNKTKADTDKLLVDMGAIDGMDVRNRVAADEQSGHEGLTTIDPATKRDDDAAAAAHETA